MPESLSLDDRNRLADLMARSEQIVTTGDRRGLLMRIGLDPNTFGGIAETNADNFAVLVVNRLIDSDDQDGLNRLKRFLLPEPATPTRALAETVPGKPVQEALTVVHSLAGHSVFREAAARFRAVFQTARDQIADVVLYKDLHDQFHELQYRFFDVALTIMPRFPQDDARDELDERRIDFEAVVDQMNMIVQRFPETNTGWLAVLNGTLNDYLSALRDCDADLLRQVLRRIERELWLRPPQINYRLNAAAHALRLSDLVRALGQLSESAAVLENNSENLVRFRNGVEVLGRMDERLRLLIRLHDCWQTLDVELRETEKSPAIEDLRFWWPDFLQRLEAQVTEIAGSWTDSFRRDECQLGNAIQTGDAVGVKRGFRLLRRQVGIRFYNTDTDLRNQCMELREIGEPLDAVLGVIP
jgi:hypothetical protein